jgi:uncharacterized membrane protein YphA (DoxX/SURF4 family)
VERNQGLHQAQSVATLVDPDLDSDLIDSARAALHSDLLVDVSAHRRKRVATATSGGGPIRSGTPPQLESAVRAEGMEARTDCAVTRTERRSTRRERQTRSTRRCAVVSTTEVRRDNPAYQVYLLLRAGFTVAPVLFGLDKFFNWMVDWPQYLAPWINDIVPGSGQDFMYVIGVIEIVAGLAVLIAPRIGSFLVAAWLGGIVINLLTNNAPEYYDIALRDFGLFLAALALGRLALSFERSRSRKPIAEVGDIARAA